MLEENAMIQKFDLYPFWVYLNGKEYLIGEVAPTFMVRFRKTIPLADLVTSTSLALGESYMDRNLEIERDLY